MSQPAGKPIFNNLDHKIYTEEEIKIRVLNYLELMKSRRSVRDYSDKPVSFEIIKTIVETALSAPSGANKQPWTFVIVQNQEIKRKIRLAAEKEEKENYDQRFTEEWLEDLNQFDTDWHKEFLETAPYLIVIFKKVYDLDEEGKHKNYYVNESVGIASGFLLTAIHNAGLVALTHTPSPMGFLSEILQRPKNEKPFLLIPVGYPKAGAMVPVLRKKIFEEAAVVIQ